MAAMTVRRIKRVPKETPPVDEIPDVAEAERRETAQGWLPPSAYPKPKKIIEFDGGLFHGDRRRRVGLGLDPSAGSFGFAAFCPDDDTYYAWVLRTEGSGVQRLMQIKDFIGARVTHLVLRSPEIIHTCMEGYGFAAQMAHMLGEVGGVAKLALVERIGWQRPAAYPTFVAPSRLKKYATGSGASDVKKQQVLLQCYKKWGVEFNDDNAADAYVLARMASMVTADEASLAGLLAYEAEVIAALKQEAFSEWPEGFLRPTSRRAPSPPIETSSSESVEARTPSKLRRRSPTPSTTTATSPSGSSVRRRSIKRSRP